MRASIVLFCSLVYSTALAETRDPNPHIELLTPYLDATCPAPDAVGPWAKEYINGAPPLSFAAYNTYFNDVGYDIRTSVKHDIDPKESKHSKNNIRGLEELSDIRFDEISGVQYRYEGIVGARWRPLPKYKTHLYVNFKSAERVSIWREDCQAYLRVKMVSPYVQYDPSVYEVRYRLSKAVRKPKLNSIHQSVDPQLQIDDWQESERAVVMRTCYKNSHPEDDYLDVICTEHNLTFPGWLPDELTIRRESLKAEKAAPFYLNSSRLNTECGIVMFPVRFFPHTLWFERLIMRILFWFSLLSLTLGCAAQEVVDAQSTTPESETQKAAYTPPPQTNFGPPIEFQSDEDIGMVARVHFATHTPDFQRAWEFYQLLGYSTGRSGFPLTNNHVMARALGMFDQCQYELVRGAVIDIPDSINTVNVDLLQFKVPFNDDPPYELPNHLGMAYAGMLTTDLDADYAFLRSKGVDFLSAPFGQRGERFAFFRDVDGVLYKLMEDSEHSKQAAPGATTAHVIAMPYIGINVSDLDASLDFYQRLGYTDVTPIPPKRSSLAEAQAYGLDAPFEYKGFDVALARGDKHRLRLLQWITPFNPEPPYPAPINHIGIHRIAVVVADMERAVAILKKQGVKFLSEIAPCCSGTGDDAMAIVHAIDPDGVFVELVGGITPRPAAPQPAHCGPLEIKLPTAEDIKDFTQAPG